MIIGKSMFPVQTGHSAITKISSQLAELQTQLGSGKRASTLAAMGSTRLLSINVRARANVVESYQASISAVNLRLDFMDKAISRLDEIEADARTSATPGGYGTNNINFTLQPTLSRSRLDEVIQLLNTNVDGRYLFAGHNTQTKPVPDLNTLMNGNGVQSGFAVVANERQLADLGNGSGRLTQSMPANDRIDLAEDGAHPFGFKLGQITTSNSDGAIMVGQPDGTAPQSASITFAGQPANGDTITLNLMLPSPPNDSITLRAVTGVPGVGEYQIGGDAEATAANFNAALDSAIKDKAQGALVAASAYAAADNFFNGQGETVWRVDGADPATATALVAGTPADTVMWYSGEDTTGVARQTVSAKIDDTTVVNYGVQANESGMQELVKALAAMSVTTYQGDEAVAKERYSAAAERQLSRLAESHNNTPGSLEVIAVELGVARAATESASTRHETYKVQLENILFNAENVDLEQTGLEILALETRLQASYQTTANVAKLSLVNYM